ncbi:hypothetical protein [Paenibacillus gansuensis]|uniref:Uncharacterized protein n=1 Tax=Paenibacillus gansuensis TaxID=306542 RepID=A0ABW5PGY8_9BACL
MFNKYRLLLISIALLAICAVSWFLGNYYSDPTEMDEGTSFAIWGCLGTVFFTLTTLILSLVAIIRAIFFNRKKQHYK